MLGNIISSSSVDTVCMEVLALRDLTTPVFPQYLIFTIKNMNSRKQNEQKSINYVKYFLKNDYTFASTFFRFSKVLVSSLGFFFFGKGVIMMNI